MDPKNPITIKMPATMIKKRSIDVRFLAIILRIFNRFYLSNKIMGVLLFYQVDVVYICIQFKISQVCF